MHICWARQEIVSLNHKLGFKLNETYKKKYKHGLIKLWRYKAAGNKIIYSFHAEEE